ncbi:hypothetical protein ACIA5G_46025 [Amycolatopsis sp. NPDC051758]|uniref:hypothetical protein n=1 Tax=Amycolatopsis sp. NPDC051758 TaxID=3363935 RepID=UPI0037A249AE
MTIVLIAIVAFLCAITGASGPLLKETVGHTVVKVVVGTVLAGGEVRRAGLVREL